MVINQRGVSLLESLLVVVIMSSIVFLLANLPNAMNLLTKSNHTSLAREIAAKQIEDKRALQYANLVNGTTLITDSRISLLPSGSGTILVEDCGVTVCTNSENVKQLTITVTWKDAGKTDIISLKTLIGENGLIK